MVHWKAEIKESGNKNILTPELYGDFTEEYVVNFWGLEDPDVERYKLYKDDEQIR